MVKLELRGGVNVIHMRGRIYEEISSCPVPVLVAHSIPLYQTSITAFNLGKGNLMLQPIIMFVADDTDIFTVLGEVLDCRAYSVIYYTAQHLREATIWHGWAHVAAVDLRGIALEQVAQLLLQLRQFQFSRTIPVFICSDGIYCPTVCESLCRSAQHGGTTLLEPPATSVRLLNGIQQRLHHLPV